MGLLRHGPIVRSPFSAGKDSPRCRIGTRQNRRLRGLAKKSIHVLVFIALLLLIVHSPALSAQQQAVPKPLRFDLTPFIGYRTSMSFPVEPHVAGTNPRVLLDANPSYGVSFGVRLREEEDLVEVHWARQDSYPLRGHHASTSP